MRHLVNLLEDALGLVAEESFRGVVRHLLWPGAHSSLIARRRAVIIVSRVHLVALVFALLTPLWIPVDMLAFDWPLWGWLAAGRLAVSAAFIALAIFFRSPRGMAQAYKALALMFVIPMVFHLYSYPLLAREHFEGMSVVAAAGYSLLPFVLLTALSVFPLTALEGVVFAAPLVVAELVVFFLDVEILAWQPRLGALWLLCLIAGVAILAGMSLLQFMMALIQQAAFDPLTEGHNRLSGEELLGIQFRIAERQNQPLALAFVDLDHFKAVNDDHGHEEGDNVLRMAASALRRSMRAADILIRWGGEEFVVVMPNTDTRGAELAVQRLRKHGLGRRPEGKPLTASVGLAERKTDGSEDWSDLVQLADNRMYQAKESGRDRYVGWENTLMKPQAQVEASGD